MAHAGNLTVFGLCKIAVNTWVVCPSPSYALGANFYFGDRCVKEFSGRRILCDFRFFGGEFDAIRAYAFV